MTRKYAFFAVEGDSDQIIVRQVLRNFLGMALWNGKVDTLKRLPDQSNLQRDASTMRFILWVTLASSMAFFLLFGS